MICWRWEVTPTFFIMKAYKEKKISDRVFERTFSELNTKEFEWHRDKENRKIIILSTGEGWRFQIDNQIPVDLYPGMILSIPKETFHRIISGTGELKIRLVKDFE